MKATKSSAFLSNIKSLGKIYKPELELGFGLGFIAASFVMAIKATMEHAEEIEDAANELIEVHENKDEIIFHEGEKGYFTMLLDNYKKFGKVVVGSYSAPALALMFGTLCVLKSHKDVRTDQLEAMALAGSLSKELNDVYSRLEEKYGKEEADRIRYGMHEEEIEVTEVDENGKEKTVKKKVNVINPDYHGWYTYRWVRTSNTFKANAALREAVIDSMERYANDVLSLRAQTSPKKVGFLWLNELLEQFDLDQVEEGQHVGWILEPGNKYGDNYVEIDMTSCFERNQQTGKLEEVILLTFNVDGNIYDRLFPVRRFR